MAQLNPNLINKARQETTSPNYNPKSTGFELMKEGEYLAQMFMHEISENKKKNGKHLRTDWVFMEAPYMNRKLKEWINFENPNPTAVEIAQERINQICYATNVYSVNPADWHRIPVKIQVGIKDGQNVIRGVLPATNNSTQQTQPPQVNQPQTGQGFPSNDRGQLQGPPSSIDDEIPF